MRHSLQLILVILPKTGSMINKDLISAHLAHGSACGMQGQTDPRGDLPGA